MMGDEQLEDVGPTAATTSRIEALSEALAGLGSWEDYELFRLALAALERIDTRSQYGASAEAAIRELRK